MKAANLATAVALLLAAGVSAAEQPGGAGAAVTLIDLVHSALENNPRIEAAGLELEAARENIPIRQSRFLPRISTNARYGQQRTKPAPFGSSSRREETDSYGIAVEQPLFRLSDIYEYRGSARAVHVAESNFEALRQDFLFELAAAWLNWHLASDQIELLHTRARSIRSQRDFAAHLAEENVGNFLDVILVEAEMEEVLVRIEDAKNALEDASNSVKRLARMDSLPPSLPSLNVDFAPTPPERSENWISRALKGNPRLLAAQSQAQETLMSHRAAQSLHLPTVNLVGQANYGEHTDTSFIGLQVQIPIFDGGRLSAQSRQTLLQHQATLKRAEEISDQILEDIQNQHKRASTLVRNALTLQSAADRRRKYLEKITDSWREGFSIASEVLRAEEDLFDTEILLRTTYYNYLRSMVRLHHLSGALDEGYLEGISNHFSFKG